MLDAPVRAGQRVARAMQVLQITPRAARLTLAADAALERPIQVDWEGTAPTVRERGGRIEVAYSLGGRIRELSPRRGVLAVALDPAEAWTIELRGGVSGLQADLRYIQVTAIVVSGGASDIAIDLPRPQDELMLRVEGGASRAMIRRPAGVPVSLAIDGGATDLRLDDAHLGSVGGTIRQRTPGDRDQAGIAVRVLGGASGLTIDTHDA